MTIPTPLQINAYLDLIDASAVTNPVPSEITPLKIPSIDAFLSKIKQLNQSQLPIKGPALGIFYSLFLIYEEIITWSNKHFEKIPPNYGQQAILHHKTLVSTTENTLKLFGDQLPKWDTAFDTPHPDGGYKFNSAWFEDMLGIIYGTLLPNYNSINTTQSLLNSYSQFADFIDAINDAYGSIFSFQRVLFSPPPFPSPPIINPTDSTGLSNDATEYSFKININLTSTTVSLQGQEAQTFGDLITVLNIKTTGIASWSLVELNIVCTALVDGDISITEDSLFLNLTRFSIIESPVTQIQVLNDLDITPISTSYTNLVNAASSHINTLINQKNLLEQQLQREQWWWSWNGSEINYSKMTQIEQAANVSLAINNDKYHTKTSQLINRIGSPALIAAKNEIF